MKIIIRPEAPADYRETESVVREAFWNRYAPGCDEHYLLHIMRSCADFVSELSFIAVREGSAVGDIAYARGKISGDGGNVLEVLSLGPIGVLPACQGQGIGRLLIEHTARIARERGYRAILLYGDPDYYARSGFVPAEKFGIRTPDDCYADALQALELFDGALQNAKGRYIESDIYTLDVSAAAKFDEAFPAKQKLSDTPSQKKFHEIVSRRRPAL